MIIPSRLPPHPGVTSILLYNRDNKDNQIQFNALEDINTIIEYFRSNFSRLC